MNKSLAAGTPAAGMGLRERKKRQTRQAIADAAMGLFAERGFDAVTVSDVARAVNVSTQTVFNYFPAKEDLFFGGTSNRFGRDLAEVLRTCQPGQPLSGALRAVALEYFDQALETGEFEHIETTARLIEDSPALQARERADAAAFATAMAAAIAEREGAAATDIEPLLLANTGIAVYQTIFEIALRRVRSGQRGAQLRTRLRQDAERAFAILDAAFRAHEPSAKAPGEPIAGPPSTRQ
jgi:AcrR family transcriptional regulator